MSSQTLHQELSLDTLLENEGQIQGVPQNPRSISNEKYQNLIKSLRDDPEMLKLRELLVYPHEKNFIVLGGNMRLRALREIGYTSTPCKIISGKMPPEKLRAIAIKDNIGYGEHDWEILAEEWDKSELEDWGMDIPGGWVLKEDASDDGYEVPETIETDIQIGDLFQIGNHRLLCGDATSEKDWDLLMRDQLGDLVKEEYI